MPNSGNEASLWGGCAWESWKSELQFVEAFERGRGDTLKLSGRKASMPRVSVRPQGRKAMLSRLQAAGCACRLCWGVIERCVSV